MIWRAAVRLTVIAVLVMATNRLVVLPAHCNRLFRRVEAATRADLPVAVARENVRQLNSVKSACRDQVDLYVLLAANNYELGRVEQAIADLTDALLVVDRPEIYFDRGLMFFEAGNIDAAITDMAVAGEFSPLLLDKLDNEVRHMVTAAIRARKAE